MQIMTTTYLCLIRRLFSATCLMQIKVKSSSPMHLAARVHEKDVAMPCDLVISSIVGEERVRTRGYDLPRDKQQRVEHSPQFMG